MTAVEADPLARAIVPLAGADPVDNTRVTALAEFLSRRDARPVIGAGSVRVEQHLLKLSSLEAIFLRRETDGCFTVSYMPSVAAAREIRSAKSSPWPAAVATRLAREVRSTQGALFYFPDETGEGRLEVFITDWSPCPAACAVAVHAQHPYAAGFADRNESIFTGRFVRHPLTGDLLPVWVAQWVKPDFGTGAVLVNPAHDAVDLRFGRSVGLPIRFALVPQDTAGAETWPTPPVVKTGRAFRTGKWDGLDYLAARAAYLEDLVSRGLAVPREDVRLPSCDIASLQPSPDGPIAVDEKTRRPRAASDAPGQPRYRIEPSATLATAAAIAMRREAVLVASSQSQKSNLAALAPLLIDLGLLDKAIKVIALQATEPTKMSSHPLFGLGALVAARFDQPAVVRQNLVEQLERFVAQHASVPSGDAEGERGDGWQILRNVHPRLAASFESLDLATAFKLIYALQKTLVAGETSDPTQFAAYRTGAYLLGLPAGSAGPQSVRQSA